MDEAPQLSKGIAMNITEEDVKLYYKLMNALQHHAALSLKLVSKDTPQQAFLDGDQKLRLQARDALWKEPGPFIDGFVRDNPLGLPAAELEIVDAWRGRISGTFHIERYLAKHAIFIAGDKVYAVKSLLDRFDELYPRECLPLMVETVLLPFKGQIIYEGLMQVYRVSFGSGIRSNLKEVYQRAKQHGRVVESLEPGKAAAPKKAAKDWRREVAALVKKAEALRASAGAPAIEGQAFVLAKAALALAQQAVDAPCDLDELWARYDKTGKALKRVWTVLDRS